MNCKLILGLILSIAALLMAADARAEDLEASDASTQNVTGAESVPPTIANPPTEALKPPQAARPTADQAEVAELKEAARTAEERVRLAEIQAQSAYERAQLSHFLMLFGFPAFFVAGFFFARYKNYEHLNATFRSLLERGVTVPPEFLTPVVRKSLGWSDLRKGIMWLWLGVALMIFLGLAFHGPGASLGLVPLFIGGAYLLLWFMDRKKQQPKQ